MYYFKITIKAINNSKKKKQRTIFAASICGEKNS
jgi:hypothetical protein